MSPIENHVDWTAPATPGGEKVTRSLSAPQRPADAAPPAPRNRRSTLDTLLGDSNLTAYDMTGSDPYNATGRRFRG